MVVGEGSLIVKGVKLVLFAYVFVFFAIGV